MPILKILIMSMAAYINTIPTVSTQLGAANGMYSTMLEPHGGGGNSSYISSYRVCTVVSTKKYIIKTAIGEHSAMAVSMFNATGSDENFAYPYETFSESSDTMPTIYRK